MNKATKAILGLLIIPGCISASLLASPKAEANTKATLQWNGEVRRSCSLTANQIGEVVLNGQAGSSSRLDSTVQGGRPAILGFETVGGPASIGFVSGSVLRNGTEALIEGRHQVLEIKYEGQTNWNTVFQNTSTNWYNNQNRLVTNRNGQIEVEARTNAHTTQAGDILTGTYVVKTVMECISNN